MMEAVKKLEFEKAALLRDQISFLQTGNMHKAEASRNSKEEKKEIWQETITTISSFTESFFC